MRFANVLLLAGAGAVALAAGVTAQSSSPPDFSSNAAAWQTPNGTDYIPVPGSPPLIANDPAHPYVSNGVAIRTGKQPTYRIADLSNPNLKQWAKDVMKKDNDEVLAGKIGFTPSSSCKQPGVPAFTLSGGPYFFIQSEKQVLIVSEGDRHARRVYLNVPHSANPKPSWYGESVGYYENGDTLVVDTIGLNDKTYVDNFRTPHTKELHVVERFKLVDNGSGLEVTVHVEDPGAFTTAWNAVSRFRRDQREQEVPLHEMLCAENNQDYFNQDLVPIPQADKADF